MNDFILCFSTGRETKKNYTNDVHDTETVNIGEEGMDIEWLLIFIIKTTDRTQNGRRPVLSRTSPNNNDNKL